MVLKTTDFFGDDAEQSASLKTMKITVLKDMRVEGKVVLAGKTVEINDKDGRYLISLGSATEAKAKKEKSDKSTKDLETRWLK